MIVCRNCGKKKKVQRLPKHHAMWECSMCAGQRAGARVTITCFHCHKAISIRPNRVQSSEYFLCGPCVRVFGTTPLDSFRNPGQILVHTMNAAGEMTGFAIRYPNAEEAEAVERARHIRDLGLAQLRQERARKAGLPLHHHWN